MPFVRLVIIIPEPVPVANCPPLDVTVYCIIVAPPLLAGISKVIVACPFHRIASIFVGVSGVVAGIITLLIDDKSLVPRAFTAETLKI